jgi:2-polyprenyl-6-hydroxyphenyl methylase/3-demethylubiquinone-9 3-methyltransferase
MTNQSTASQDEIEKFIAIADDWWNPSGDFAPLHRLNPVRLKFIRDHLCKYFSRDQLANKPLEGLDIIDIGCGGGILAEPITRLGGNVTGIDAGLKNIKIARHHAELMGLDINYLHKLPESLGSHEGLYDVVLNMEVVEHVADLNNFLTITAALIKPGGVIVISTLNRTWKSLALAKVAAEYVLQWLPIGTHDWRKFVKPSELAAGLAPSGIEITDVKGMTYRPFNDDWQLSNDITVNYLVFCIKKAR